MVIKSNKNKAYNSSKSKKYSNSKDVFPKIQVQFKKSNVETLDGKRISNEAVLTSTDEEAPLITRLEKISKNTKVSKRERLKSIDETNLKPNRNRGRKKSSSHSNNDDDQPKETEKSIKKSKSSKKAQLSAAKRPRQETKTNSEHITIMKDVNKVPPDNICEPQKKDVSQCSSKECIKSSSVKSRKSSSATTCNTTIPSRRLTRLSSKDLNVASASAEPEITVKNEIPDDDSSCTNNKITLNQTENQLENQSDDDVICITDNIKNTVEKKQCKITSGSNFKGCRLSRCFHHSPAKNLCRMTRRKSRNLENFNAKIHSLVVDLSDDMFYHDEPYVSPIYISDDDSGSISCMPFTKSVSNETDLKGRNIETISLTDSVDSRPDLEVKNDVENNLEFSHSQFNDITGNRLADLLLVPKSEDCENNNHQKFLSNDHSTKDNTNLTSRKNSNITPSISASKDTKLNEVLATNIVQDINSENNLSELNDRNKDCTNDNVSTLNPSSIDTELNELFNCLNSPDFANYEAGVNTSNKEPIASYVEAQLNKSENNATKENLKHTANNNIKTSDNTSLKSSSCTYKRRKSLENNTDIDQGNIRSKNKSVLNSDDKDVMNKVCKSRRSSSRDQREDLQLVTKKLKKCTGDEYEADQIKEINPAEKKNALKRKMINSPVKESSKTDNAEVKTSTDGRTNIKAKSPEQVQSCGTPCKVVKYSSSSHSMATEEVSVSFQSNFKTDKIDSLNDNTSNTCSKREETAGKECTVNDRLEASKRHRNEKDSKHRSGSKGDNHKTKCEDEKILKQKKEDHIKKDREKKKHEESLIGEKEVKKSLEVKERAKGDCKKHSDLQRCDKKLVPKESNHKRTDSRHKTKDGEDKNKHSTKHKSQNVDEKASLGEDKNIRKLDSHKLKIDVKCNTKDDKIKDKDSKKSSSLKSDKRVLDKEKYKEREKYDSKSSNNNKNEVERKKDKLDAKYHDSQKSEKKIEKLQTQKDEKITKDDKKSASSMKEENDESDKETIRRDNNDLKLFSKQNYIKLNEVKLDNTLVPNSKSVKLDSPKRETKSNVNHQNKIISSDFDKFNVSVLDSVEISQRDFNLNNSEEDVESNKMRVNRSENLLDNVTPDILKNIQDESVQTNKEMYLSFSNSIKINVRQEGNISDSNYVNNTNQTQNILNQTKPRVNSNQTGSLSKKSEDGLNSKLLVEKMGKKSVASGTKISKVHPVESGKPSLKGSSIIDIPTDGLNNDQAVSTSLHSEVPRICSSIKIGFHVKSVNIDGVPMFEFNPKLWKYADVTDKSVETVELHKYVPKKSDAKSKEGAKEDSSTQEKINGMQGRGDNKRLSELEIFFLPYCRNLLRYNRCNVQHCQSVHKFDANFLKSVNFPDAWCYVEKLMSKPEEYLIAEDIFLAIVHWLGSEGKRNKLLESALYLSSLDLKLADSQYLSSCWSALVSAFTKADVTMINASKNILQRIASHSPPFKVEMIQKIIKFIGLLDHDIEEVWPVVQVLKKVSGFVYSVEFFERMMANTVRIPRSVSNTIKDILSDFTEEFLKLHISSLVNIDAGVVEIFSNHLISFKLHHYDLKLQSLLKHLYKEIDKCNRSPGRLHPNFNSTNDSVPHYAPHTKESANFVPNISHMKDPNLIANSCGTVQKDVSSIPKLTYQSKGEPEIGSFDNSDNLSDKSSSSKSSHSSRTSGRLTSNPFNHFGKIKFSDTSALVNLDCRRETIRGFNPTNELPQVRNPQINVPATNQIPPLMSLNIQSVFSGSKDPQKSVDQNISRLNSYQFSSKSQINDEPSPQDSLPRGIPSVSQPTGSSLSSKIECYGRMKESISRGLNMQNIKQKNQNDVLIPRDLSPNQEQYGHFNKSSTSTNDTFSRVSSKSDSSVLESLNHIKKGSSNETVSLPFQKIYRESPFNNELSKFTHIPCKSQALGNPCSEVSVPLVHENTIQPKQSVSDDPFYSIGISVKKMRDNNGRNDNTKKSRIMALPFPREEGCYTINETDCDSSSNAAYQKELSSHLSLERNHIGNFSNCEMKKFEDFSNYNKNFQQSTVWKDFKISNDFYHSQNFSEKLNKMLAERKISEIFETLCVHSENKQTMERLAEDIWQAFSKVDPTLFYPIMRDLFKMMENESSNYHGNVSNIMCLLGTVATKGITDAVKHDMWLNAYDIYNIMLCCGYSTILDERFNKSKDEGGFSQVLMAIIICEIWTSQKAYDKAVEIIIAGNLLMSRDQWNFIGDDGDAEMVKNLTEFLLGAMSKDVNDKDSYLLLANFLEEVITSQKSIRGPIDVKPAVEEAMAIFHDFNSDKNYRLMLVSFYEFLLQVDNLNDLNSFSYRILLINFIRLKHEKTEEIYSKCLQHRIYNTFNGAESYLDIQCNWTREEMFFILNKWFEAIALHFYLNKNFIRKKTFIIKYKMVDMSLFSDLERPKRLIKIDQRILDVHSRFNNALSACLPPITYELCDLNAGIVKLHSEPCEQLIYIKLKKLMWKNNSNLCDESAPRLFNVK